MRNLDAAETDYECMHKQMDQGTDRRTNKQHKKHHASSNADGSRGVKTNSKHTEN